MKQSKIWRRLNDALHTEQRVAVTRGEWDEWPLLGFVVGLSDEWALLHVVDGSFVRLNGYCAVRVRDISRITAKDTSFFARFLALQNEVPVSQPDILLVDLPGLLSSASALFPLIQIETEGKHANECYIGRVVKIGKRTVTHRFIKPRATWRKMPDRYALRDITKVVFGDAYNVALWRIAQEQSSSRPGQ